jgi:FtsP/CotA-like multicopper oxidase with cupredoxin domain
MMFALNGQQPGPLLQVAQGAEVTVELTDALDQPTTVHWHGIRLDNAFDGVPDLTQRADAPGERFTHRLRFPDAGIYWYHPHMREAIQQDLGLYGNLMVRSPRPDYFSPANREEVLMLDDFLVDENGLIPIGERTTTHAHGPLRQRDARERRAALCAVGKARRGRTLLPHERLEHADVQPVVPGAPMKVIGSDVGTYEREA